MWWVHQATIHVFLFSGRRRHTSSLCDWSSDVCSSDLAQQLARVGHEVHVFEKNGRAGGLLRYGIPDFKMEKLHVDRRVRQMEAEGVTFHYGVHVGETISAEKLLRDFDAVLLSGGAEKPRDLAVEGRDLDGIHFAMDFLPQQ